VSTPIQAAKEPAEGKSSVTSFETSSSFTQLHLPEPAALASTASPAVTPLMVLGWKRKARVLHSCGSLVSESFTQLRNNYVSLVFFLPLFPVSERSMDLKCTI
jgi:hypothetical protein